MKITNKQGERLLLAKRTKVLQRIIQDSSHNFYLFSIIKLTRFIHTIEVFKHNTSFGIFPINGPLISVTIYNGSSYEDSEIRGYLVFWPNFEKDSAELNKDAKHPSFGVWWYFISQTIRRKLVRDLNKGIELAGEANYYYGESGFTQGPFFGQKLEHVLCLFLHYLRQEELEIAELRKRIAAGFAPHHAFLTT